MASKYLMLKELVEAQIEVVSMPQNQDAVGSNTANRYIFIYLSSIVSLNRPFEEGSAVLISP